MRKTLYASVFVLVLCGSAFAGDINSPPIAPCTINCPPSAPLTSGGEPADGRISTVAEAPAADDITYDDYTDGITAAALTVLNSVLALL